MLKSSRDFRRSAFGTATIGGLSGWHRYGAGLLARAAAGIWAAGSAAASAWSLLDTVFQRKRTGTS